MVAANGIGKVTPLPVPRPASRLISFLNRRRFSLYWRGVVLMAAGRRIWTVLGTLELYKMVTLKKEKKACVTEE